MGAESKKKMLTGRPLLAVLAAMFAAAVLAGCAEYGGDPGQLGAPASVGTVVAPTHTGV